ncbi:hypothetical protein M9Y10_044495 [Tritrichomonas musculus]|uniref:Integrase catalytic domain-containing protein n=1 Tax=Tritrichomonas musculus TaxID=1915356 RepID=A0ABR2JSZ9_9EUKA
MLNLTKLLHDNTNDLINYILNNPDLKDSTSHDSTNQIFIIDGQTREHIDFERNYIKKFIKNWLRNKLYNIDYEFSVNDERNIDNFIQVCWNYFHEPLVNRIHELHIKAKQRDDEYLKKQRILNKYQRACKYAKDELIRKRIYLKSKTTLKKTRDVINDAILLSYDFKGTKINEDDIRMIYDDFVNEWNKRNQQTDTSTKQEPLKLRELAAADKRRTLSLDEWYNRYLDLFYYQPSASTTYHEPQQQNVIGFKSVNKVKALKALYPEKTINEITTTSYFPLKQNIKKYQLHKVAKRHSYIIDLMFVDKLCYLVAININTRFLIVEVMNRILFDSSINEDENKDKLIKFGKYNKSAETFIKTLDKIIQSGTIIKHLTFDGEGAFVSSLAKQYYRNHDIEYSTAQRLQMGSYPDFMKREQQRVKTDPMHSSLGLIDRVIRTIRDMAYNMNVGTITPSIMNEIVNQYNNAPHKTLSLYAGIDVRMISNLKGLSLKESLKKIIK